MRRVKSIICRDWSAFSVSLVNIKSCHRCILIAQHVPTAVF
ncbi:hypothetical protein L291_2798 [Acinetobacter guillouiae MSP4-18]|nr:hypothetical protein L291_2798 [Acinetobacter guillouiae MSP4-18]